MTIQKACTESYLLIIIGQKKCQLNYLSKLQRLMNSSIVITFAGAFSLSASIFGNMDKISDARLFLITLFNVLFVVNILDYLFHFIKSIKQENPKYNWKRFFLVNIFLCIFGACVYSYFVHTQKTQITAPDTASETISSKIKTE